MGRIGERSGEDKIIPLSLVKTVAIHERLYGPLQAPHGKSCFRSLRGKNNVGRAHHLRSCNNVMRSIPQDTPRFIPRRPIIVRQEFIPKTSGNDVHLPPCIAESEGQLAVGNSLRIDEWRESRCKHEDFVLYVSLHIISSVLDRLLTSLFKKLFVNIQRSIHALFPRKRFDPFEAPLF